MTGSNSFDETTRRESEGEGDGTRVVLLGSLIRVWRNDRRRVRSDLDRPVEVELEVEGRSIDGNSNNPASRPTNTATRFQNQLSYRWF